MIGLLPALGLGAGFLLVFGAILWGLQATGKPGRKGKNARGEAADSACDALLSIIIDDDQAGHGSGHGGGDHGGSGHGGGGHGAHP